MCGRARLSCDGREIKPVFGIPPDRPTPNFAANQNMAAASSLPVVWFDLEYRRRSLDMMRWGLIPHWAKDVKIGYATITRGCFGVMA
jgi:putative SOS response-associated peptidase YedK